MSRLSGGGRATRRATLIVVVAGAAVLAPVQMARGAPRTRFAVLPAGVAATPEDAVIAAGPAVPPPAGRVSTTSFPLSHLGVRWTGSEDARVDVRVAAEDGAWGPWRRMPVDHDLGDEDAGRFLSQLIRVDGARRVQARAAGDADGVELLAIDTVSGPRPLVLADADPARAADPPPDEGSDDAPRQSGAAQQPSSTTTTTTPAKVDQPKVVSRAQWGADETLRKGEPKFAPITKLFVHHTVTAPGEPDPDPASTVRAIYAYHTQGNGWDDIGYNFLVDAAGKIYEGRWARSYGAGEIPTGEDVHGYGVVGAHTSGYNFGSAAVAMIGDFTAGEPTSPAMASLERMLAWKADRHDIDVEANDPFTSTDGTTRAFPNLAGHRDAGRTACPGDSLYPLLPALRQRVSKAVEIAHSSVRGYWVATADGRVLTFGDAQSAGSLAGTPLNAPIVGMAATPTGGGYWLMGGDGGVFTFGDARFYGSTGNIRLNQPVVRLEPTPTGKGYWLVASDGGIFTFGDAQFFGSTGAIKLNQPIVGMATTPTGRGYWLVASDGGIFSFGDARFAGSTGAMRLNSPVVSMAADADGTGYWLVARDGGVFTFDVPYYGSIPGLRVESYPGSVQLRATPAGKGYYVADVNGGVFIFGDARSYGADASQRPPKTAVDLVLRPSTTTVRPTI